MLIAGALREADFLLHFPGSRNVCRTIVSHVTLEMHKVICLGTYNSDARYELYGMFIDSNCTVQTLMHLKNQRNSNNMSLASRGMSEQKHSDPENVSTATLSANEIRIIQNIIDMSLQ